MAKIPGGEMGGGEIEAAKRDIFTNSSAYGSHVIPRRAKRLSDAAKTLARTTKLDDTAWVDHVCSAFKVLTKVVPIFSLLGPKIY